MSKNVKPKKTSPKSEAPDSGVSPPGVVGGQGHGMSSPIDAPFGLSHLRDVLRLSADVPQDKVCQEAALDIKRLRRLAASHKE